MIGTSPRFDSGMNKRLCAARGFFHSGSTGRLVAVVAWEAIVGAENPPWKHSLGEALEVSGGGGTFILGRVVIPRGVRKCTEPMSTKRRATKKPGVGGSGGVSWAWAWA